MSPNLYVQFSIEEDLLLCCARTVLDKQQQEIKRLLQLPIDWSYFDQVATEHGVKSLAYSALRNVSGALDSIPIADQRALHQYFQLNSYHNIQQMEELLRILHRFEAHQIPVLSFKGPVLALSAYRDLALRNGRDLDLLVHHSDHQRAITLLEDMGYNMQVDVPWECHLIKDDGEYIVDLHRDIVPNHLNCGLSSRDVWNQLSSTLLAGKQVACLSPELELLVLCLNGTKECWQKLNRICDIAELLRTHSTLNWRTIQTQAKQLGSQRLIFLGLHLAHSLLDAPIPAELKLMIDRDSTVKTLAYSVKRSLFSPNKQPIGEIERSLFHIKTRERWRDKWHSLSGLLDHSGWMQPSDRDKDLIQLPTNLEFLYYLIRPIRILQRYGANLWS
jgi:hypothetical protein